MHRNVLAMVAAIAIAGFGFAAPAFSKTIASHAASGHWVCNAYGKGGMGSKTHWQTYSGSRKATESAARQDALNYCRGRAFGCQPSGCFRD